MIDEVIAECLQHGAAMRREIYARGIRVPKFDEMITQLEALVGRCSFIVTWLGVTGDEHCDNNSASHHL